MQHHPQTSPHGLSQKAIVASLIRRETDQSSAAYGGPIVCFKGTDDQSDNLRVFRGCLPQEVHLSSDCESLCSPDAIGCADEDAFVSDRTAVGRPGTSSWRTYNFEVATHHNYIADEIRVHNKSVLSFLKVEELRNLSRIEDTEGDGDLDFAAFTLPGRAIEVEVRQGATGSSELALFEATGADEYGNLIYMSHEVDQAGKVVPGSEKQIYLTGQHAGASIAGSLTPFLSAAFLGDDASLLEEVAADTIIGTVLHNVGEVIGGYTHRAIVDVGEFSASENLNLIAEKSFADFGGEIVLNGTENVLSVVNQLIMAEIFEDGYGGGVPGAVFEKVVSTGLSSILSAGTKDLIQQDFFVDFFKDLDFSTESINAIKAWQGTQFPTGPAFFQDIVITAILEEVLPAIETQEGQIASAVAQAAFSAFSKSLGSALAGPAGFVASFVVGKIFDSLFEKSPQAWTSVGFDETTGRFVLLSSWQDDGGNIELSRSLAQAYLDGINAFVDTVKSESHNFDQLGRWSFGHYEDALKNAGKSGQTFGSFQTTYVNAVVTDMSNAELLDGQMAAVRALELGVQGESLASVVNDRYFFANFKSMLQKLSDSGWDLENIDRSTLTLDFRETLDINVSHFISGGERGPAPEFSETETFRNFLERWVVYLKKPVPYVHEVFNSDGGEIFTSYIQSKEASALAAKLTQILSLSNFRTLEDFVRQPGYAFDPLSDDNLNALYAKHTELRPILAALKSVGGDVEHSALDDLSLAFSENLRLSQLSRSANYNDYVRSGAKGPDLGDYANFRQFLEAWKHYLRPVSYPTQYWSGDGENFGTGKAQSDEAEHLIKKIDLFLKLNFLTLEDFLNVASPIRVPAPPVIFTNKEAYDEVSANLQIADDYHTYLENRAVIDDMIALHPNSALAAGWIATLAAATELGLNDPYDVTGDEIDNVFYTGAGNDTVRGQAGDDLIKTYLGDDELYGNEGNDTLIAGAGNDFLDGGIGDDSLIGGAGDDTFVGGPGADHLNGGDGTDFADYSSSDTAVKVNLLDPSSNSGDATGDSYVSIEGVIGTDFNDDLRGDNTANTLFGGSGNDLFFARDGDDFVYGGDGNDILIGGAGADTIDGGKGVDRIQFNMADTGVQVDLLDMSRNTGDASGDVYISIENIRGTDFDDDLRGTNDANMLHGSRGDDLIFGRGGNDNLIGADGDDILIGGTGADKLDGGNGIDRAQYTTAASGVVVDLAYASNNTGDAFGDKFYSIEDLRGSRHSDDLRGNADANTLMGDRGDDVLDGRGGNDRLVGGSGADTFQFFAGSGSDTISDFEDNIDSIGIGGFGYGSIQEVLALADQTGNHVTFDFGNGDSLMILNIQREALDDDIFLIV